MTSETTPFVRLDDARPRGRALLYSEPAEIIQTREPAELARRRSSTSSRRAPTAAYRGAIGGLARDGQAAFNVAIRTLTLKAGANVARLGPGSGIVAASQAGDEWGECLAKGEFVESGQRFDLIEAMGFDPEEGVAELDRHLNRMKRSAEAFGFMFDRHLARNELQAATFRAGPSLVRMRLSRSGAIAVELRNPPETPPEPVEVKVVACPVPAEDFRLRHKTSDRAFYDEARVKAGVFEVIFRDQAGFLTEGSFTSLFVERGGKLLTPPLSRGLLPGVLRERLIEEGQAEEADLVEADLVHGFLIGNSARGLIRATLFELAPREAAQASASTASRLAASSS